MSTKSHNIRIGIFVLVAIGLFVAGLLAFGARTYFVRKDTYETAIAGDVSGLSVGSKVLFRGVPIGKVSNIDFALNIYPETKSRMIVVEVEVDRQIFVRHQTREEKDRHREEEIASGLRAMVKGQGVTGTSILSLERLDPKENPPPAIDYKPRYPYIPSAPGQFTRMLESIEHSLRNLQKLDFQSIGDGASNALGQASLLLQKLNRLNLETTIAKADGLLDNLNGTVGNIDNTIKSMKLESIGHNADDLVAGLKESNKKLQYVLEHFGDLQVQDAVDDVRSAVHTLNETLLELKGYPSGFIFGDPPAPAKSVQPSGK